MAQDDTEIVSALHLALADKVGTERFELWFSGNTRFVLTVDELIVQVPSPFYQDWLRNHFRSELEAAVLAVVGQPLSITFQVDVTLAAARAASASSAATSPSTSAVPNVAKPVAEHVNSDDDSPLTKRRFATFESLVVGESNHLAVMAARNVVAQPGAVSPLVIYGPTGVGKTHLLEAIWGSVRRTQPRRHCVFMTAEQFTSHFLGALHGGGLPNFRRKYRGVDLLVLDGLHFLSGKRATAAELLHTVDSLLADGRQLVVSLDRSLDALADLAPELIARLQGGLVCELSAPTPAMRRPIVEQLARRLGMHCSTEVLELVARRITTHARAMTGALKRLQLAAEAHDRPLDVAWAEELLGEIPLAPVKGVRLADVEQAVCRAFGLDPASLHGASCRRLQQPRMLAMWLARKHTRSALNEIGRYFGLKSHSTVLSAQKRVDGWVADREVIELADGQWPAQDAVRRVEKLLVG